MPFKSDKQRGFLAKFKPEVFKQMLEDIRKYRKTIKKKFKTNKRKKK